MEIFTFPTHGAPEIYLDQTPTLKSDMWALGVILYQLISSKHPFGQEREFKMIKAIQSKEPEPLPDNTPQFIKDVISKLLEKSPEKRPDAASLLNSQELKVYAHKIIE